MNLDSTHNRRGRKILLVEDIHNTIGFPIVLLESRGHEIIEVTNVAAAAARLKRERFDVILLDWRLPVDEANLNVNDDAGSILLDQVMADENNPNRDTPVVVVTAQWTSIPRKEIGRYPSCRLVVEKYNVDAIVHEVEAAS
ncbi:MAG: response regulator [Terriglobia bacterium]